MFFILCPYCHGRIEIAATGTGPDCIDLSNAAQCDDCQQAFFFDAREVIEDRQPETV